jgi:hypothetical protein
MSLVEAEFEDETLYPMRGKSCSTVAMPFLGDKFTTYRDFAIANLAEIYTNKCLDEALKLEVNTLASGVLINDGKARFTFRSLPRLAQIAPGFGLAFTDVDADGQFDLYLVQNFFSPQVETGRMDGGLSVLLRGMGDGTFTPVWPGRSGLVVPGDAKGLTTVDLNHDGRLDFVVGVNDGPLQSFVYQGAKENRMLIATLDGPPGNTQGAGARVTLLRDDDVQLVAEVYCGGGYLSQSVSVVGFGLGPKAKPKMMIVRWPDGNQTKTTDFPESGRILIAHP